jgi:hypothetical protein
MLQTAKHGRGGLINPRTLSIDRMDTFGTDSEHAPLFLVYLYNKCPPCEFYAFFPLLFPPDLILIPRSLSGHQSLGTPP